MTAIADSMIRRRDLRTLYRAVATVVAASGAMTQDNVLRAYGIMRNEVRELLAGDGYADLLDGLMAGEHDENFVLGTVIRNCIEKIRGPAH